MGDVDIDVLEVVLACAADGDFVYQHASMAPPWGVCLVSVEFFIVPGESKHVN